MNSDSELKIKIDFWRSLMWASSSLNIEKMLIWSEKYKFPFGDALKRF